MNLQREIAVAVAAVQREVTPRVHGLYRRGLEMVMVERVAEGRVRWRSEDGRTFEGSVEAFRGRDLEVFRAEDARATFLDRAWALARGSALGANARAGALRELIPVAPTQRDAETLQGWVAALVAGREPTRSEEAR